MRVQWDRDEVKAQFEAMTSVLIKRLHPDAIRVNGSGGDGGRDLIVETVDGVIIFEMKSFTGRLAEGGRKNQIAKSLTNAAKHDPVQWRLVMPRNGTPGELTWFTKLTANYPFPCVWLDQTWLDAMMAEHPAVPRYFLEGEEERVVRLWEALRELPDEPGSALAIMDKGRELRQMLNESDPYYEYGLHLGGADAPPDPRAVMSVMVGTDRVDVVPRYPTAVLDRPITLNATFALGTGEGRLARQFREAMRYGDPVALPPDAVPSVTIDAPAGLGTVLEEVELRIAGLDEQIEPPLLVAAIVRAPDAGGSLLATLDFKLTTRRRGTGGVVLRGSDDTGLLGVELRLDIDTTKLATKFTYVLCNVLPERGEAVGAWMAMVTPPNTLELDSPATPAARVGPQAIAEPLSSVDIEAMFRSFRRIQERAGVRFEVPADLTEDEVNEVMHLARMLEPERSQRKWESDTIRLTLHEPAGLAPYFEEPGHAFLLDAASLTYQFRGSQLELGRYARHFAAIVVESRPPADEVDPAGGPVEIELDVEPRGSGVMTEWLQT